MKAKEKLTSYKMRAECQADLGRFLMVVAVRSFTTTASLLPDMDAEFTSPLSLDEIRKLMAEIEDGHVMLETVNYKDQYTGERG